MTGQIICQHPPQCQCEDCIQDCYDLTRALFGYPPQGPEPELGPDDEFAAWLAQEPPVVVPEEVP